MSVMTAEVRRLVARPNYAHIATLMPDGAPHSVPVWIDLEGDNLAILTGPGSRKARNLKRDPRLAISIVDVDQPYASALIRGQVVEFLEGPGEELLRVSTNEGAQHVTLTQTAGKGIQIISEGPVSVTAKNDATITAEGTIARSAVKIAIDAKSELALSAPKVTVDGTASLDLTGAKVAVKGSASAELSSAGATVVSGSLVKIN